MSKKVKKFLAKEMDRRDFLKYSGAALLSFTAIPAGVKAVTSLAKGTPALADTLGDTTVIDNLFTIEDDGDNSKQAQFEASGISTGTLRTYSFPDTNTTLAGTDATQTLTNKTLSGSSNTFTNIDHHAQLTNFTANDDHTQYALLAGRSGGQTLTGGTGASDLLTLKGSSNASLGMIGVQSPVTLFNANTTFSSDPAPLLDIGSGDTYTLSSNPSRFGGGSAGAVPGIINFGATLVFLHPAAIFGSRWITNQAIYKNDPSVAANLGANSTLSSTTKYQADTQSITTGSIADIFSRMTFDTINGGTLTSGNDTVNYEGGLTVNTGATVSAYEGFVVLAPTVAGTLTNMVAFQARATGAATNATGLQVGALTGSGTNIGVDIVKPTTGTANIGLRNAGPTVLTTSSTQTVTSGGTVTADATHITIISSASVTLSTTSATIAVPNAQMYGQILHIINANTAASGRTITFTSGSAEKLSLAAATRVISPGGSLSLLYNNPVGRWVELGSNPGGN